MTIYEYIPVATTSQWYMFGDGSKTACYPGDVSSYIPLTLWNVMLGVLDNYIADSN